MKTLTAMRWFACAMCACRALGDTTPLAQGTVEAFRKAVHETDAAGFPFHSEIMKMFQWMPFISYFSTHYYLRESLLKLPELRSHRAVGRTLFPLAEAHDRLPQAVEEYGLKLDANDVILFVDGSTGFGPIDYFTSWFLSMGKFWKGTLRSWCHKHLGVHFGDGVYMFPFGGLAFETADLEFVEAEGKLRKESSQLLFLTSSHLVVRSRPCNHWKLPLSEIMGYRDFDEKVDSSKSCLQKQTSPWTDDGRIPQLGDDYVGLRLRTRSGVLGRHMLPRGKSYALVRWKDLQGADFSDLGTVCHLKEAVKSHPNFTEVNYFRGIKHGQAQPEKSCFSLKWTAEPYLEMPAGSYEEPSLLHAIVAFAQGMKAFTTLDPWETLERGDRLLKDGLCEEALDNYLRAAKMNPADAGLHEWRSLTDFRIHQAQQCLGIQRPRLGESTCMDHFPELRNPKLIEDFLILSSPQGWRRVKHLEEWRRFFQLSKKFNTTDVTKAKRKLLKKYHPDKHQADADCAHQLSMWIMAGAELLKEHRSDRTNEL